MRLGRGFFSISARLANAPRPVAPVRPIRETQANVARDRDCLRPTKAILQNGSNTSQANDSRAVGVQ